MKFEVSFSQDDGFVRTTVYEPITTDLAKEYILGAMEVGKEEGVSRYLYDIRRAPNATGLSEQFAFSYKQLQALGVPPNSKSALLVGSQDLTHDFIEIVTRNAGYECRIFRDEDAAVSWLKE